MASIPPIRRRPRRASAPAARLSPRQRAITRLLARGLTNAQIAAELGISEGTAANHIAQILMRLDLQNRSEVAAWAVAHGLADAQDRLLTVLEHLLELSATTLHEALSQAADVLAAALGADKVDAFLHEPGDAPEAGMLVAVGASATPMAERQRALGLDRLPLAHAGRAGAVFSSGEPALVEHLAQDPVELPAVVRELGARALVAVPLHVEGRRRGVLQALSATPEAFSERDLRFLAAVSRWVGSLAHRAELAEQATAAAAAHSRHATAEDLATALAHDLRTHLTPLRGHVAVVRRRALREARTADVGDAEAALQSLDRLERLVTDLLDVARLERGLFALAPRPMDLAALVRETAAGLQTEVTRIRVDGPDALPLVGAPDRLRQALENLLGNALEHSAGDGGVTVELTAETRQGQQWLVVAVADQGPGIPPQQLAHLFEPFAAGPGGSGLGLGLYLAQQIVMHHGGTLAVASRPGAGTRVTLAVPAAAGGEPAGG